jgi:hypothetical protein
VHFTRAIFLYLLPSCVVQVHEFRILNSSDIVPFLLPTSEGNYESAMMLKKILGAI